VNIESKFKSTGEIAKLIGLSKDFLLKKREVLFFKGKHYFEPNGLNKLLWEVDAMLDWIKSDSKKIDKVSEILENLEF
jgi:hypothetical protein